jgi:hypothetical protein
MIFLSFFLSSQRGLNEGIKVETERDRSRSRGGKRQCGTAAEMDREVGEGRKEKKRRHCTQY